MKFTSRRIARKKNIPVRELESFDFQMSLFDTIPNEKQMDLFFSDKQDLKKDFFETLEIYKEQDIYRMTDHVAGEESMAGFENRLIRMRNEDWIPKLIAFMQEEPAFIAVGAGHLAGEHGIIRQFREKGYQVEPIMLIRENEGE